jgi:hypothetical protein
VILQIEPIEDALHAGQRQVLNEAAGSTSSNAVAASARRISVSNSRSTTRSTEGGRLVRSDLPLPRRPVADVERILSPIIVKADRVERRFDLVSGGTIDFWSLDSVDAGRGRRYDRVIIDEAGIVRDLGPAWQETIRATLADRQGDAWFLGTPKGRSFFHRCFERGQIGDGGWKSWRLPTTTNPTIPAGEIEAARQELPKHIFDQEFLGIPADDGGNPFGLDSITACVSPLSTDPVVAIGIDLAKSVDWTVVVGLDKDGRVAMLHRWQGPWMETERRILDLLGDAPSLIDSTGVGDPIVEGLQRKSPRVEGFKFSATSKQQIMEGLASAFQTRRVAIPDGWLRTECETFEYTYTRTGVRYEAPSECTTMESARWLSLFDASTRQPAPGSTSGFSDYADRRSLRTTPQAADHAGQVSRFERERRRCWTTRREASGLLAAARDLVVPFVGLRRRFDQRERGRRYCRSASTPRRTRSVASLRVRSLGIARRISSAMLPAISGHRRRYSGSPPCTATTCGRIVDHPILDLLNSANPYLNGFDLSVLRVLYGELTGNAYLHPVIDDASGVPIELWPLAPQHVEVIPDEDTFIRGYVYGVDSQRKQIFEPDEVIHFRRPNPGNCSTEWARSRRRSA